ncbi:MAG: DUF5715 family protein [Acidimicrobiales bacterium]
MATDSPDFDSPAPFLASDHDFSAYRSVVSDLAREVEAKTAPEVPADIEALLTARLDHPELQAVLAHSPDGQGAVVERLLEEVRAYQPNSRSSASDVSTLVRIYLLSQIDSIWWADATTFQSDDDVLQAAELVALESLQRRRLLQFTYRLQPKGLAGRTRDWAIRRIMPRRRPHTAGVSFTNARPELVALLNRLAIDFADRAPSGTPQLWVTSLTRSLQHQHRLRDLGYAAMIPSAHCCGYAADVEMRWFGQFGADHTLAALLLEEQDAGLCNVIDEGQAWHVCINPDACDDLRQAYTMLVAP